jgi:hypothetical protein
VTALGKTQMVATELFAGAITATRITLLLFYYRLVRDTGMFRFNRFITLAIVFNVLLFIFLTALNIGLCKYDLFTAHVHR